MGPLLAFGPYPDRTVGADLGIAASDRTFAGRVGDVRGAQKMPTETSWKLWNIGNLLMSVDVGEKRKVHVVHFMKFGTRGFRNLIYCNFDPSSMGRYWKTLQNLKIQKPPKNGPPYRLPNSNNGLRLLPVISGFYPIWTMGVAWTCWCIFCGAQVRPTLIVLGSPFTRINSTLINSLVGVQNCTYGRPDFDGSLGGMIHFRTDPVSLCVRLR
jgi:hypothetical protein